MFVPTWELLGCVGSEAGLGALSDDPDAHPGVVDVGDDGSPEPEGPDHAAEADAFFAEGTLYELHIALPDESRASLSSAPKTWVPATLTEGDESWDATLRLKGTTTLRTLDQKAAFKLDVHDVDPDARFHGLKRITLNSMLQDSSMLHEHVAYWLFRHRGLVAPRHTYAKVWVNDDYYGLYGVVETGDSQFLNRALPDDADGNLYEANVCDMTPKGVHGFVLDETGDQFPVTTDLAEAFQTIADATPDGYVDALASVFDLDALLNYWAIDIVSGNVDGYTRLTNNYRVYHGTTGMRMIPWGYDQAFQFTPNVSDLGKAQGQLISRCGASPACLSRLRDAVLSLMDDWDDGDFASMASDEAGMIQADCRADPRSELPCDVGHVMTFILGRPEEVRTDLGL